MCMSFLFVHRSYNNEFFFSVRTRRLRFGSKEFFKPKGEGVKFHLTADIDKKLNMFFVLFINYLHICILKLSYK